MLYPESCFTLSHELSWAVGYPMSTSSGTIAESVPFRVTLVDQVLMEIVSPLGVACTDAQFLAAQFLKMCGLSLDEEFVDGGDRDGFEQSHVDSHADLAEVMHCLFATDFFSSAKNTEGSADMIVQIIAAFLDEKIPRFAFVFDQSRDHFADPFEDLRFAFTESHLVADLIQVPHELRTFSEQPSDCDVDLSECAEYFFDLFGCDESWQMEHDADSQAGTDICRTSGEVA